MLHIRMTEEIHRKIRFICADADMPIQTYVMDLINKDIGKREKKGGIKKK
jgi:hypothetical protein